MPKVTFIFRDKTEQTVEFEAGKLEYQGHGLPESWLAAGLTLRFRAGGERLQPRGRRHHHSLKDLFQQSGVVPWMRERVPLLYRDAALVAIGDLFVSADVDSAPAQEPRWRVCWSQHPPLRAPERR